MTALATARRPAAAPRPSDLLVAFFAVALVWMVLAAAAQVAATATGEHDLRWLALHFALLGGVSLLVLGAAQFFACAFLATTPPDRRLIRAQLVVWNLGVVAVAIAVPAELTPLAGVGGTLILAGLALFVLALRELRRSSLQRQPWATRWYTAGAAWLAAGASLGPVLAAEPLWTHGSLLGAHLTFNLGGWFGSAIVGTLHTLFPSLTGTRLWRPELQRPTFFAWTAGIGVLAAGLAFGSQAAAIAGWALLLAGALLLGVNVVQSSRLAVRQPTAAHLVAAGQAALVAGVLTGLVLTIRSGATAAVIGPDRGLVAALLLAGWIGLTVAGSLLRLLTLMNHVRRMQHPGAAAERDRLALAGGAAVVAGLLVGTTAGGVLVAAGYVALAARIVPLAVRAVRAAPLRI